MRRAVAALLVAIALATPAAGLAASPTSPLSIGGQSPTNPLTPGLPQPASPTPTAATPTVAPSGTSTSSQDSGLSGKSVFAIAIGAAVVLGGIAFFIWHDARRRAPVKSAALPIGGTRTGTKPKPKPRKPSPAERKRRKRGRAR